MSSENGSGSKSTCEILRSFRKKTKTENKPLQPVVDNYSVPVSYEQQQWLPSFNEYFLPAYYGYKLSEYQNVENYPEKVNLNENYPDQVDFNENLEMENIVEEKPSEKLPFTKGKAVSKDVQILVHNIATQLKTENLEPFKIVSRIVKLTNLSESTVRSILSKEPTTPRKRGRSGRSSEGKNFEVEQQHLTN